MSEHCGFKLLLGTGVLTCGLLFAGAPQQPADPPKQAPQPGAQQSRTKEVEEALYGNTPEELKPFGRFVKEPYKRYFVPGDSPVMFWGPGREKSTVDPATLKSIKIGVIAPIERSYETYVGRSVVRGMQIALDDANAAGGFRGTPFEAVLKNDSGLWGATANEIVDLTYEDKTWVVIGTIDGANTHIAIRVALRTDIPMVNVADLDPTLVETRIPWVVRVIPDDRQQAYTIAFYLYKQLGFSNVAILRASNRYGRFGVAQFRKSSIRLGKPAPIEINYEPNWDKVNPDFTVQMERLEKVQPDAVVLWADAEPAGVIVKKMRERGLKMPVLACERIVNDAFLKAAGAAAEGIIATYPYDPDSKNPRLLDFRKKYQGKYGEEPDAYAVHSYDGTMMAVEAIRKAGLNRYIIRDVLAEMRHLDGISGEIIMDEALTNRRPVTVTTVKGGKFVFGVPKFNQVF